MQYYVPCLIKYIRGSSHSDVSIVVVDGLVPVLWRDNSTATIVLTYVRRGISEVPMVTSSNGIISVLLAPCAGNSPVNSPHKSQWRGALMFSLIWAWINGWVNNREAGDLRRQRAHYDVIAMPPLQSIFRVHTNLIWLFTTEWVCIVLVKYHRCV